MRFGFNRTEPSYIPLFSQITGPFRYDFFVGSLKGHTNPNDPWMHVEKSISSPPLTSSFALNGPSSGAARGTNR